jgi:N-acetylglucosamine kinase-like BadF-type ATPase
MSKYYIALQGAAKEAVLAACDSHGGIAAVVRVGPLTPKVTVNFRDSLIIAIGALAAKLGHKSILSLARDTKSVCVAMSGVFLDADIISLKRQLEDIQLCIGNAPVICEDVWAVLGAAGINQGGVIMASTGSNIFFRDDQGTQSVTVGGWGSDLADLGSGFHIGRMAISRILESLDERRPVTERFQREVLAFLGLHDPRQLVPWYHELRLTSYWRSKVADITIVVSNLAEKQSDPTSLNLIEKSSHELCKSVRAAVRRSIRLGILGKRTTIILSGGLAIRSSLIGHAVRQLIHELNESLMIDQEISSAPLRLVPERYHPIVGALVFACEGASTITDFVRYERIAEASKTLTDMRL